MPPVRWDDADLVGRVGDAAVTLPSESCGPTHHRRPAVARRAVGREQRRGPAKPARCCPSRARWRSGARRTRGSREHAASGRMRPFRRGGGRVRATTVRCGARAPSRNAEPDEELHHRRVTAAVANHTLSWRWCEDRPEYAVLRSSHHPPAQGVVRDRAVTLAVVQSSSGSACTGRCTCPAPHRVVGSHRLVGTVAFA